MSRHPQRATLCGNRLRDEVERAANWRVHGDFRITWRFERRVHYEIAAEPHGERSRATLRYVRNVRGDAKALERGHLVLKAAWQDALERGEVGRHVQSESVRCHAARDSDAD